MQKCLELLYLYYSSSAFELIKLFIVSFLLVCFSNTYSQSTINGTVVDSNGTAIVNASAILKTKDGKSLIYSITDDNGRFKVSLESYKSIDSLMLQVNCLGYSSYYESINDIRVMDEVLILLEKNLIELQEVVININDNKKKSRDTIIYNVDSFNLPENIYIGDVIANMPGMSILEDGSIIYNGHRIKRLYLHGDDFLSGRYGALHRTIPKNMIKSVEVFLNDQPVKVLRNMIRSNDVAINLVLKDENQIKWTKDVLIGAGGPTIKHQESLNAMLFNSKFKNITYYKGNNIGISYDEEITDFQQDDYLSGKSFSNINYLISSGTVGVPDLSRRLTYRNASALFNANTLYNHSNDWSSVISVQSGGSSQTPDYKNRTNYFTGLDTFGYSEIHQKVDKTYLTQISAEVRKNDSDLYFSNKIQMSFTNDKIRGNFFRDPSDFKESLRNKGFQFSNMLRYIPLINKNNVIEIDWFAIYLKESQNYNIYSFRDSEIIEFNNQLPISSQNINKPAYFSNLSLQYRINNGNWKQSYLIGLINERKKINSELTSTVEDLSLANSGINRLIWDRNTLFVTPTFQFRKYRITFGAHVPLNINFGHYSDPSHALKRRIENIFINPEFRISYDIASEDLIELSLYSRSEYASLNSLYRGYIMTNYRSIQSNESELFINRKSGVSLRYDFKRSINLLFSNVQVMYDEVLLDNIQQIELSNTLKNVVTIPYAHKYQQVRMHVELSKYINLLKSTSSFKAFQGYTFFDSFINHVNKPFISRDLNIHLDLSYKKSKWFEVNFSSLYNKNLTFPKDKNISSSFTFQTLKNNLSINLKYKENLILSKSSYFINYYGNNLNSSFSYSNINLKYIFSKKKFSVDLELFNVADRNIYEEITSNQNIFSKTSYTLNGRRLMLVLHMQL